DGLGETPWFYAPLFDGAGLAAGWRANRDTLAAAKQSAAPEPWLFRGWYVNLQRTWRRPWGFDAVDQTLDIIVRADGSWYWKDEDELALAVAKGACSQEYADRLRAAGEDAISRLEAREPPFDSSWQDWRAPADWRIETLPDGWQTTP